MNGVFPFVLDRTISIALPENLSTMKDINKFQEQKAAEVRKKIGDLLAFGVPYELRNSNEINATTDAVEVYVPGDVTEHKKSFETIVRESGFSHWQKIDGKTAIVQRAFGLIPRVQRFVVDRNGFNVLRDAVTYKMTEENRKTLAQMFFPEEEFYIARRNISFESSFDSPSPTELVIRHATKFHPEINLHDVVFPLYALENGESTVSHELDFVKLTERIRIPESV